LNAPADKLLLSLIIKLGGHSAISGLANIMSHRFTILFFSAWPILTFGQIGTLNPETAPDSVAIWLAPGNYTAQIMTGNTGGQRVEELSMKMMASIQANQEWYLEFAKTIPKGGKMPYHENIGLTREEYDELIDIYDNIQAASAGEEDFKIYEANGQLKFDADGQVLMGLTMLIYDKNSNSFYMDIDGELSPPMTLTEPVFVDSENNGPYSKWHAHRWTLEDGVPTDEEVKQLTSFDELNFSKYTVTVGRTEQGKIVFNFKIQMVSQGQQLANNELPLLFE
jgi:hypothetical protein